MSDQSIPGEVCGDYESGAVMDAERMLNEFADMVEQETRHKLRDDDNGLSDYLETNEKLKALREYLIELIRSGLAIERADQLESM